MRVAERRRPPLRLLALLGLVRVRPCRLCGALVVVEGQDAHDQWHAAGTS